ncbi:Phytanoyl-CoA dioxygenase domain containing 1 [Carabus blaptoides fortunei]
MALLRDKSLRNIATGEYLYNKATDLLWDEVFVKYCTHPKLLDYIGSFIGPDITAIHSMFINKPPDSGKLTSTHPLHQDLHYFPVRPVEKVVGSWTALEKTTKENGCLHVIPGSHRSILQYHGYPEYDVNYGFHGVRGFDDAPKVYLEMEKGDTVFLHPLILHGSGPNLSKRFRKAISVHYASSHCHYVDVTNTSQELIGKEAQGMAKRVGVNLSHIELLKMRNVLVRGNRGILFED